MDTKEIIDNILLLEKNNTFYKEKIQKLENQINDMSNINSTDFKPNRVFDKNSYTSDELSIALEKMLAYEGLKHREGKLIIDTFIEFLDNKHNSLNKK